MTSDLEVEATRLNYEALIQVKDKEVRLLLYRSMTYFIELKKWRTEK